MKKVDKSKLSVIIYVPKLGGEILDIELKILTKLFSSNACKEYSKKSKFTKIMLFGKKNQKQDKIKFTFSKN